MALSSEKFFPFDSDEVDGKFTREYVAEDFARYFRAFISSGTFMAVPDNLQVIANGDMTVTLKPGSMMIEGYRYDNISDIIIPITPADGVLSRIDRISVTWSNADDDIHYTLQEGAFSYSPVSPACRRTADYKDYVVADIMVQAGAISIQQKDITDQRLNSAVCGLAIAFGGVDTTALYDQIKADLHYFQKMGEEKFTVWFEQIRNQLTEDAAGNLQIQIGNLEQLITVEKMDLVSALNEICRRVDSSSEMLQKTIGDAFSEGNTYEIGEYAIYENTLYRFTAAKTAGAWDPDKVQAVTVAEEIRQLNGNMMTVSGKLNTVSEKLPKINGSSSKVLKICAGSAEASFNADGIATITMKDSPTSGNVVVNLLSGTLYNATVSGNKLTVTSDVKSQKAWVRYIAV